MTRPLCNIPFCIVAGGGHLYCNREDGHTGSHSITFQTGLCDEFRGPALPQKVYIAFGQEYYEGDYVVSVHRTRAGAEASIVREKATREHPYHDYSVLEFELQD